jgi:CBS domain-containing protein
MNARDAESALDFDAALAEDESYFASQPAPHGGIDGSVWKEPITVVPTRTLLVCSPAVSVREAMQAMQKGHRGYILITEDGSARSRLLGIFTERDILLRVIESPLDFSEVRITEVMTRDPEALPVDARLAWALNMMAIGGYRHVPVVDRNGWPTAVLAVRDIVEFLAESFPAEILNLPPDFGRKKALARDGA